MHLKNGKNFKLNELTPHVANQTHLIETQVTENENYVIRHRRGNRKQKL